MAVDYLPWLTTFMWMQEHGSSLILNWGEDDGHWECSWITSGKRYTGISRSIEGAVMQACQQALDAVTAARAKEDAKT